jgi:hypothetical protein
MFRISADAGCRLLNVFHGAVDANFRMNNRAHGQKAANTLMGPGFAHVVDPRIVSEVVKNTAMFEEAGRPH